jgi:cobalamin biosynthesis protein CbiG
MVSIGSSKQPGAAEAAAGRGQQRGWLIDGVRRANSNSLPGAACAIKIGSETMGNALRQWLEANGLLAIDLGVLGAVTALSLLLVVGSYFMASLFG